MEKNLRDGFDDFLKKSFEGFEENPSDDVWEGISNDLNKPVPSSNPKTQVPFYKTWWGMVAAVVFIGAIAVQFLYFQNKIDDLTQKIDNRGNKTELKEQPSNSIEQEEEKELEKSNAQAKPNESNITENKRPIDSGSELSAPDGESAKALKSNSLFVPKEESAVVTDKVVIDDKKNDSQFNPDEPEKSIDKIEQVRIFDKLPPSSTTEIGNLLNDRQSSADALVNEKSNPEEIEQQEKSAGEIKNSVSKNIEETPVFLPLKKADLLTAKPVLPGLPTYNLDFLNKIKPIRKTDKGISLGATAGFYRTTEKLTGDLRLVKRIQMPFEQHMKAVFQEGKSEGQTFIGGLELDIDLNKNWGLVSGLKYRKDEFKTMREVYFKFRELRPRLGTRERDFAVVLNSSAGLTVVDFRVEENGDTPPIQPDEKIKIQIQTLRSVEYVTLPILGKYRFKTGNWNFAAEGGVLNNFTISNSHNASIRAIHTGLMNKSRKKSPKGGFSGLKDYTPEGLLGLNVGYGLTEKLNVYMSPNILFSLVNRTKFEKIDSKVFAVGVNAGMKYHF